ncbi:ABC transporter ATP-binding protein [Orenia marismortui]|uniref:ABC transporter ATP-binding protein n=1 Tax=Orenia marismortui TaxID=46469 RepID=UPI000362883C|nr:energy-coupling factor transporter ATPase [Orenia marismortui]
MKEIIRVEDLTFKYPGADEDVLDNVNLKINQGDFVAIIGSNGSGKTTLCKTFNGLIPHYHVGDYEGKVIVGGNDTLEIPVSKLAQKVGYVYQNFEDQLVRPTVYDEVTFAPLNFGFEDYKKRGEYAIELLGLESIKDKFIWELSGGQKHLVALAGVLALDPEIIVIDEPVAQLDPANAIEIYEKLKYLNEEHAKTIIVIEHHTEFIGDYCKSVVMMGKGYVAWQKPVKKALSRVEELREKNIFPPQVTQAVYELSQKSYRYPITLDEGVSYFSDISKPVFTMAAKKSSRKKMDIEPVITFHNVKHSYRSLNKKKRLALKDLNLSFYEGDRVALIGNNGAGKSTLLKMITGLLKPKQGEVMVCAKNTQKISSEELAEDVTYIYQNPEEMFISDNIRQDIEYYLKARGEENLDEFVDQIIETLGLSELQDRDGRLLSGGQQRRASLAIGTAMKPSVILLDEPTASLDIVSRKEMLSMIEKLEGWVKTVIVATHDMQLVSDWADRIIVLNKGEILKDTDQYGVFEDGELLNRTNIKPPQILELSRRLKMKPIALSVDEFVNRLGGEKFEVI